MPFELQTGFRGCLKINLGAWALELKYRFGYVSIARGYAMTIAGASNR